MWLAGRSEYIKPDGTIGLRSTQGWYERFENNGWRPISERVLVDEDPITTATRLKRQPLFHYSPGIRRWGPPWGCAEAPPPVGVSCTSLCCQLVSSLLAQCMHARGRVHCPRPRHWRHGER